MTTETSSESAQISVETAIDAEPITDEVLVLNAFTRCCECALSVIHTPCGFCSKTTRYCSDRSLPGFYKEVGDDDGCTFGVVGDSMQGIEQIEITISDRAAVNGCPLE